MTWTKVSGRVVYDNPWIRIVEDQVRTPDDQPGMYGVLELHQPAGFVVAVTPDDKVVLVNIDRYTVGESWEVPAGGVDAADPLAGAQRELLEESGLVADDWTLLAEVNSLNGVCRAPGLVYLARGARPARDSGRTDVTAEQEAEGISQVITLTWDELLQWITAGKITDNETLGSLMLAFAHRSASAG